METVTIDHIQIDYPSTWCANNRKPVQESSDPFHTREKKKIKCFFSHVNEMTEQMQKDANIINMAYTGKELNHMTKMAVSQVKNSCRIIGTANTRHVRCVHAHTYINESTCPTAEDLIHFADAWDKGVHILSVYILGKLFVVVPTPDLYHYAKNIDRKDLVGIMLELAFRIKNLNPYTDNVEIRKQFELYGFTLFTHRHL